MHSHITTGAQEDKGLRDRRIPHGHRHVHAIEHCSTNGIGLGRLACEEPDLPTLLIQEESPAFKKLLGEHDFGKISMAGDVLYAYFSIEDSSDCLRISLLQTQKPPCHYIAGNVGVIVCGRLPQGIVSRGLSILAAWADIHIGYPQLHALKQCCFALSQTTT